jgi:hypothetical protein
MCSPAKCKVIHSTPAPTLDDQLVALDVDLQLAGHVSGHATAETHAASVRLLFNAKQLAFNLLKRNHLRDKPVPYLHLLVLVVQEACQCGMVLGRSHRPVEK